MSTVYLLGLSGYFRGQKFKIDSKAVIGRDDAQCNILYPIKSAGISDVHCELKIEGSVAILKDCGSTFGTYLSGGTKLEPNVPVVLTNQAKFWLGSQENWFEIIY